MKSITLGPKKTIIKKHSSLLFSQGIVLSTNNQDEHLIFLTQSTLFEDYNSLLVICLQPSPTSTQFPTPTNVMLHDPHSSSKSQHNMIMIMIEDMILDPHLLNIILLDVQGQKLHAK
jgi:hypothetical protein